MKKTSSGILYPLKSFAAIENFLRLYLFIILSYLVYRGSQRGICCREIILYLRDLCFYNSKLMITGDARGEPVCGKVRAKA